MTKIKHSTPYRGIATHVASEVEARIVELRKQQEENARHLAELEGQVKLARGTRDLAKSASTAVAIVEAAKPSLADQVAALVVTAPHAPEDIAKALGVPVERAVAALRPMKADLVNIGTAEAPRWFRKVGDNGPARELNAAVAALILDRPMTFQELINYTGARRNRVSGALVALVRDGGLEILKLPGNGGARWFIMPKGTEAPKHAKRV